MAFAEFLKTKIDNVSLIENNTNQDIKDELEKLFNEATSKLKVIPVKFKHGFITIGTNSFEIEGIPAITLSYNSLSDELKVDQSSTTFTEKSIIKYSEILKEIYDNYDFIFKVLKEQSKLHDKIRSRF